MKVNCKTYTLLYYSICSPFPPFLLVTSFLGFVEIRGEPVKRCTLKAPLPPDPQVLAFRVSLSIGQNVMAAVMRHTAHCRHDSTPTAEDLALLSLISAGDVPTPQKLPMLPIAERRPRLDPLILQTAALSGPGQVFQLCW